MKTLTADVETRVNSQFKAMFKAKCPKCRVGKMFSTPIYTFGGQNMNRICPHCGFQFEIEPGFFYVAMFASYALNIAEMVTLSIGTYVLTGSNNPWIYTSLLIAVVILLSPFNFRYSRVILLFWLTPGIHYEPKKSAMGYNPMHPNN